MSSTVAEADTTVALFTYSPEEDTTARAWLTKKGFDPDDVHKKCRFFLHDDNRRNQHNRRPTSWTSPLIHCSKTGNIKMCRYLFSRGAGRSKKNSDAEDSLYYAALYGHLEFVRLLFAVGGAHDTIRKSTTNYPRESPLQETSAGFSPLRVALNRGHFDFVQYLILKRALSSPPYDVDGGGIDDIVMRSELRQEGSHWDDGRCWKDDKRRALLLLTRDTVATHDKVVTVLLTGTILSASSVRRHPKSQEYATSSNQESALVVFNGKSGILELIADYAVGTQQQARTLRQLMDRLPAFIANVPFVENYDALP